MPTIRQRDNRSLPQLTAEGSVPSSPRFVKHQSLTITVVHIVRLSKSTLSPDEDQQHVRSKRRDQYQSDSSETNDKTEPFNKIVMGKRSLGCNNDRLFPKKYTIKDHF